MKSVSCFLLALLVLSGLLHAQNSQTNLSGRWAVTLDSYGSLLYRNLCLLQQGNTLSGDFAGDKLNGTVNGKTMQFVAEDGKGGTSQVSAAICYGQNQPITIAGTVVFTDPGDKSHPHSHPITGRLTPPRPAGGPRHHEFTPTVFYREFSAGNKPVLTVWPGDAIHTTTVDAAGVDEKGVTRVSGGNPETGPFFIETAMPGDVLAVHVTRLRLNRDYAISDDGVVGRGLTHQQAVLMKDGFKDVRWHLDLEHGVATQENPGDHLKHYSAPLRPMLGCIATAPGVTAPPNTGDSGEWGGNMDFNEIVEGTTVYLPVSVPGALLYVGDGHALEGDGELNGNALETSMDVDFTVDVSSSKGLIIGPRVESLTHIMAMGLGGSLDDAFRMATDNMARWLTDTYNLTPSEVAEVLGTSAEYKVSEVADRNAGIVLKIDKERLQAFKGK